MLCPFLRTVRRRRKGLFFFAHLFLYIITELLFSICRANVTLTIIKSVYFIIIATSHCFNECNVKKSANYTVLANYIHYFNEYQFNFIK